MKYSILTWFFAVLALIGGASCEKNPSEDPAVAEKELERYVVEGEVALPTGSVYQANALQLTSPLEEAAVANGRYRITTIKNEFTTQIASTAAGEPVLMGFAYPGQTNFTIDARSTAIALLMNTPAVYSLSEAGKLALLTKATTDPAFPAVVTEIERLLRGSTPLLHTGNTALMQRLNALYAQLARRTTNSKYRSVTIQRAGRNFVFTNNRVGHASVVGIYRGNDLVKQLIVDPVHFVPTSLAEIVQLGLGGGVEPKPVEYALVGDGDFVIKTRTGRPGSDDNTPEHAKAFTENVANMAFDIVTGPFPQYKYKGYSACLIAMRGRAIGVVQTFVKSTQTASTAANVGSFVLGMAYQVGEAIKDMHGCFANAAEAAAAKTFWGHIAKLYLLAETTANVAGSSANVAKSVFDWYNSAPAVDTCFAVRGNAVASCNACLSPAQLQLLTNGNTKTWLLVGVESAGVVYRPGPGVLLKQTFNINGIYFYQLPGFERNPSTGVYYFVPRGPIREHFYCHGTTQTNTMSFTEQLCAIKNLSANSLELWVVGATNNDKYFLVPQ